MTDLAPLHGGDDAPPPKPRAPYPAIRTLGAAVQPVRLAWIAGSVTAQVTRIGTDADVSLGPWPSCTSYVRLWLPATTPASREVP